MIRAFSAPSPPTNADTGATAIPNSAGSSKPLVISSVPILNTDVVVARVISSRPSSPRKTKPSTPREPNTWAITKCIRSLATPIAAAFGLAGFAKGPKILNTVGTPSSFLATAACFIAG